MELLNAIKSLGAFAVFIESILIAYTKPTMLNDKETHILGMFASKNNMEKNKDYGTPRSMSKYLCKYYQVFFRFSDQVQE